MKKILQVLFPAKADHTIRGSKLRLCNSIDRYIDTCSLEWV